jgi:hypothetical protein
MKLLKQLFRYLKKLYKHSFYKKTHSRKIDVSELPSRQERRETKNLVRSLNKYSNITGGKGYYKKVPAIDLKYRSI